MNILIPGGMGYIGSVLVKYLSKNPQYQITVVDNCIHKQDHVAFFLKDNNVNIIKCDFEKYLDIIPKYNTIIFLPAIVGMPACKRNPKLSYKTNVELVEKLCNKLSPSQRLIFPMTTSGYGSGFCDENSPLNPVSEYGKQKCIAEKIILEHANSVSLRLATVFGVSLRMRFDLMINDFINKLYNFEDLKIYEGNYKRNFVHIRDVVRCMTLMLNPSYRGIYNVGHPSGNFSKLWLAKKIREVLPNPNMPNIYEVEGKDVDQRNCEISVNKLIATGFKFETNLENGIMEIQKYLEDKVGNDFPLCEITNDHN